MKTILTITVTCFSVACFSQAPFRTVIKEPRTLKVVQDGAGRKSLVATTPAENATYFGLPSSNAKANREFKAQGFVSSKELLVQSTAVDEVAEPEKKDIDFFKNNVLSYSILNKGESRMTVSSQVVHYKLYVADPTSSNTSRLNRYHIPLLLIAKLSSANNSQNTSSSLDALDYEAAPLTLRIMPSWVWKSDNYKDALYYGFYADLRTLSIYDALNDKNDLEVLGSGGIGFTYEGAGSAGLYNTNGEYQDGNYSLSLIFQAATGNKELTDKLFVTDNDYLTSLQGYFLFKIGENNKLNIKIGFQHFFQETIAGTTNSFSVALGI